MKLKDLAPHPKNPRKITDQKLQMLEKAIEEFGSLDGIIYNQRTQRLVGGHQRRKIDPESEIVFDVQHPEPDEVGTVGYGHVFIQGQRFPFRMVDWDEKKEMAANLAANKGAGEWDFPEVSNFLLELDDGAFDMDLTMFDQEEREKIIIPEPELLEPGCDEDETPVIQKESVVKLGDLFELGNHRLLCGDSTSIDAVERLMSGQKADMVFTDPPYNQETEGGEKGSIGSALRKQSREIEHLCDFNPDMFLNILPTVFEKNRLNAYCFCNKDLVVDYLKWARDSGYTYNILVWKKPSAIPIGGSYRPDIEYLLVFRRSGIFNGGLTDVDYSKVLEHSREKNKVHPTMKPVEMIENQLKIASNHGSLILDPFGGSGSTLIACEKTNRKCFMMELDPHYCSVIIERWQKYSNKKAYLLKEDGAKILYDELKNTINS